MLLDVDTLSNRVSQEPDNIHHRIALARVAAATGDIALAESAWRDALTLDSFCGDAWYGLALLAVPFEAADFDAMTAASEQAPDRDRMLALYALGIVFDRTGELERSLAMTDRANALQSVQGTADDDTALFDRHGNCLGPALRDTCSGVAKGGGELIVLVGMPRSGTTLVEQILAAHPEAGSAGETEVIHQLVDGVTRLTARPFPAGIDDIAPQVLADLASAYVDAMRRNRPESRYMIDKLNHNFLRVGLFAAVLPDARIVEARRNPIDTCLSIYQHHFVDEHAYATNLARLGHYYRCYESLMSFWRDSFPGFVHTVNYESLVADPEKNVRSLLDFCGMTFEEACLSPQSAAGIVDTPSAAAVRQPIHDRAIDRASRYGDLLSPLRSALMPG